MEQFYTSKKKTITRRSKVANPQKMRTFNVQDDFKEDYVNYFASQVKSFPIKFPPCPNSPLYLFEHIKDNFDSSANEYIHYQDYNNQPIVHEEQRLMTTNMESINNLAKKTQRWDGKDTVQNLSSKCRNIFGKSFCKNLDKKRKKDEVQKLAKFLQDQKAKFGQFCFLFCYEYLLQTKRSSQLKQLEDMGDKILDYITNKMIQIDSLEDHQKERTQDKLRIFYQVVFRVFMNGFNQVDYKWVEDICAPLFSKNQQGTISKPLKKLKEIQDKRLRKSNQQQAQQIMAEIIQQ